MIGTTLTHYRIESKLGEGGMGVVYRASDTQLGRPAAIKVLRAETVAHPERKRRFINEARAASALNHPGIVTIYHIGSEADTEFIAMELVPGRPLDQVIAGRAMPIADAVRAAIQIADALASAHGAGIVHRDLKPANVMVTDKGQIKLLDFGVAKLTDPNSSDDAQVTASIAPQTGIGIVVGTAAYMSPEQARGLTVDARSDIYSFGVVLHEMLTGRRPALEAKPVLPPGVPRDVSRVVARCLELDPARRFQVMADVRLALEDADLVEARPATARRRRPVIAVVAGLGFAVAGAAAAWWLKPVPVSRTSVLTRLTRDSAFTTDAVLSNDGRFVAYASDRAGRGNLDIWIQQVAGGEPRQLTSDPANDVEPAFSSDGSRLAFRSDRDGGGVYVVSALGGDARRIVDGGRRPRWSPDDSQIAYWQGLDTAFLLSRADAPRVFVAPASGGEAHAIAADFAVATAPVWSADGRLLLFSGRRTLTDPPTWWIVGRDGAAPVDTGARAAFEREGLLPSPGGFILPESWAADGTVLFSAALSDGTNIWSTKVLPDGRVSTPERLTNGTGLEAQPSGSPETTLAFTVLDTDVDLWTLPIDTAALRPTGPEEPVTRDAAMDAYPTLSADGSVVVFYSNRLGATNLWMREMATGAERVLAVDAGFPGVPVITRDGSRVLYEGRPQTKWFALPLSGAGASPANMSHLVCDDCHGIWDVTSDGKWSLTPRNGDHAIRVREAATGRTFEYLQAPDSNIGRLRLSPDDRWVTLTNRAGGFVQVVVAPFRPGSIVDQVDQKEWIPITDGNAVANAPAWSPDGRVIYYLGDTDGSVCVWGRRIDPATGRPVGDAVAVWHFHEARRSLSRLTLPLRGLGVARNRLVVSVVESTGSVWLSRPRPDRESARGQGSK